MRTLCLYNPHAGRCSESRLRRAFAQRKGWGDIAFRALSESGNGNWFPDGEGPARVAVFGGDGTLNHVIQHLAGKPWELCVFPAGTANDLGCAIGASLDWGRTLDAYEAGRAIAYDTIGLNGRHVITGGGFGLGYAAAASANRLRSGLWGGLFRYGLRAKIYLLTLSWHGLFAPPPRMRFQLHCEGASSAGASRAILFCNQALMGKRVLIAPGTSATDGKFHLVRFRHASGAGVLRALGHLKSGSKRSEPWLDRNETGSAVLEFEEPVPAYGDGEEFLPQTRWELRCHAGSIRLRVPAGFPDGPRA